MLLINTFGNPHSVNPTSKLSTELVQWTRTSVLDFFIASSDDYEVIYTANASHALKLVDNSYPFRRGSKFALTIDNHTSVLGISELATAGGCSSENIPLTASDLGIKYSALLSCLSSGSAGYAPRLFAYPARSTSESSSRSSGSTRHWAWDGTFFRTRRRLSGLIASTFFERHRNFVPVSFYSMFGYLT
jgi:molybdenum cofactor sulfurtransferase